VLGRAKIIQRSFPLYGGKNIINRILRLALNVVQYCSVRLKVIADGAALQLQKKGNSARERKLRREI